MKVHGKYTWIPAAMENDLDGVGLFLTYKKWRNGPIRVKQHNGRYVWIDCPDRDIIVQRERFYDFDPLGYKGLRPENYDEYIHLDVNHASASRDMNLKYSMLNATSVQGTGHREFKKDREESKTKFVIDSGGFQLYSKVKDFIKPEDVIAVQNKHGDLGMVLDLPFPLMVTDKMVSDIIKIQRANTDIMLKHKREDLQLVNVIQGIAPEHYMRFAEEVYRKDITRVAFAFVRKRDNPLTGIRKIAHLVSSLGSTYSHYHVLGVSDLIKAAPIMWLAKMGIAKQITSDSSTHVRNAASGVYLQYPMVRSPLVKQLVSRLYSYPSRSSTLPCGCAVCSSIKWSDVLSFVPGALMTRLLGYHNLIEYKKYMETINQIIQESDSIEAFIKEIKWSVTKERHAEIKLGLHIVEDCVQRGIKYVNRKYELQLHQGSLSVKGLFNEFVDSSKMEQDRVVWIQKKIKEYKKYHGLK